jgi:hypothetical protein
VAQTERYHGAVKSSRATIEPSLWIIRGMIDTPDRSIVVLHVIAGCHVCLQMADGVSKTVTLDSRDIRTFCGRTTFPIASPSLLVTRRHNCMVKTGVMRKFSLTHAMRYGRESSRLAIECVWRFEFLDDGGPSVESSSSTSFAMTLSSRRQ